MCYLFTADMKTMNVINPIETSNTLVCGRIIKPAKAITMHVVPRKDVFMIFQT